MAQLVEVEGADRARRALERASSDLDELDRTVGQDVAGRVLVAARWGAPRRTGLLASSGALDTGPGRADVVFGARYAPPVHYGVPSRGMAAQPFLDAASHRVEATTRQLLERAVDRIARRAD